MVVQLQEDPDGAKGHGGGQPRYQRIAATIQSRIERGVYRVGEALPTEQDFCAEMGASRYTVREALRRLSALGLVRRRQGSGTVVIATSTESTYLHSMRSLSELFEYAADTQLDILSMEPETPNNETVQLLGRSPGRTWLSLKAVRHTRQDAPICYTCIWVHNDFAEIQPLLPDLTGPIYQLLESQFGVTVAEVVQEITVEPFPEEAARAIETKAGDPAVRLLRRYLDDADRPLIVSASWHPAEAFSYTMRLKREDIRAK